jgi:UV excision repair protein RAD23
MAQSSPDLIRLVQENRDELRALLLEDSGSIENLEQGDYEMTEDVEADENNQVLHVTLDEQAAIDRLGAMGFDPARVVEAFFACERNEEMAANYLLEHLEDD